MTVLFKDGVIYKLWQPETEERFEEIVKAHSKELFGSDSLYFDIKHKIVSVAGRGSIPDGYVVSFSDKKLFLVEYELSKHDPYRHIGSQTLQFASGMDSLQTRDQLAEVIYNQIKENGITHAWVKDKVGGEIYKYIKEVVSGQTTLVIVIDEVSETLKESTRNLPLRPVIVEYQTYQHEKAGMPVHIHSFEPIWVAKVVTKEPEKKGEFTLQSGYTIPILETLVEMGGSGKVKDILNRVYTKMMGSLTQLDLEKLPSGQNIRWKNYCQWERQNLITNGHLQKGSPRGVWEITNEGRRLYKELRKI